MKICDFGLSRMLSFSSSAAGTFLGTACYMSPERLNGQVGRPGRPMPNAYAIPAYTYAYPIRRRHCLPALRCMDYKRQGAARRAKLGLSVKGWAAECSQAKSKL